ncbi:hypothetical protein Q8A67_018469 [Cirrhinus molitorella]|uniref:Uncharacterized protein n=1 Tax=Cirrhinus molitorella TaxID=172907 RepID=A0AA88TES4_9TELE|nr:hypothetical protein Q8A67_018469 [Cirrhinus molitorella]
MLWTLDIDSVVLMTGLLLPLSKMSLMTKSKVNSSRLSLVPPPTQAAMIGPGQLTYGLCLNPSPSTPPWPIDWSALPWLITLLTSPVTGILTAPADSLFLPAPP